MRPILDANIKQAAHSERTIPSPKWRRIRLFLSALLFWNLFIAITIMDGADEVSNRSADTAIVLGAAVYNGRPSPVFAERINHAVTLYNAGKVRKIIFTGGIGNGKSAAESVVGKTYAAQRGVPDNAMLIETQSHTTLQNLLESQKIMRAQNMKSALIVTDPLHNKRSLKMAYGIGMHAAGSPTPTSRYRSARSQSEFLMREIFYYNVYLFARR
jgi:uncharacterized SAM-binding protein YcdF (DUF218 family)